MVPCFVCKCQPAPDLLTFLFPHLSPLPLWASAFSSPISECPVVSDHYLSCQSPPPARRFFFFFLALLPLHKLHLASPEITFSYVLSHISLLSTFCSFCPPPPLSQLRQGCQVWVVQGVGAFWGKQRLLCGYALILEDTGKRGPCQSVRSNLYPLIPQILCFLLIFYSN